MYYARHRNNFKFRVVTTALLTRTPIQLCVVHSLKSLLRSCILRRLLVTFRITMQIIFVSAATFANTIEEVAKVVRYYVISDIRNRKIADIRNRRISLLFHILILNINSKES